MSVSFDQQLISKHLDQLLEEFGSGNPVPGSGSAAALMGMIACKLCLAVIQQTKQKESYSTVWPQVEIIKSRIETLEPALHEAFQRDSDEFAEVVDMRVKRDKEIKGSQRHKQLSDQARNLLRNVTRIPLEVCEICLEVGRQAIDLFDSGYQAVRGESGAAACSALAGANSALFISYVNLKCLGEDVSADEIRNKCSELLQQLEGLQNAVSLRLTKIREEVVQPSSAKRELTSTVLEVVKADRRFSQPALPGFPQELPLAARNTSKEDIEETTIQQSELAAGILGGTVQSDDEVFSKIFNKYARGKNKDAWFKNIRDFFDEQGLVLCN